MLILTAVWILLLPCNLAEATNVGSDLVVGIQSSKTLLIRPFDPQERDMLSVYNIVYESLVSIDDDYLPQPLLAQSWESSSSGAQWTFHLREDVSFTNGQMLTAEDVVASAQYILDRATDESITDHGFYGNLRYFISSIRAVDEHTVAIKTNRQCFGFLYAMTFPIVPASMVGSDSPPGTGPYAIREFHAGERMWLRANESWWKAQPMVRDINFLFHDTAAGVMESYEYARVDTVFTRSIAGAQYKTGTSSLAMRYRTNQLECLLMNNQATELTLGVRQAIRFLIDKSRIISNVYSGLAVETNFPFYPGTWMYNESLDSLFRRDVEEARRLLAEEGWEDSDENGILDRMTSSGELRNLSLRFYYYEEPDNDVRSEAVTIITDALSQVGINCRVEPMTLSGVYDKIHAGSFDLALVSYAMDVCPDPGFLLMPGNTGNFVRYKSERMDQLCKDLRKELNYEGYRQKLMEIQNRFYEDCPFVCLYWRTGNVVSRYMYTSCRDVREYELFRGIDRFGVQ